jgi:hypothetical protein
VTTLRSDINAGNTRDCQAAIEDLSESLLELEESDVPANYKVGQERTDDDVSLFLLTEFMVHAQAAGAEAVPPRTSRRKPPPSRSN